MKLLSWKYPEEMPLKETPFTIEEAEELQIQLNTATDGKLNFASLFNVFNYRNHILKTLKDFKSYEEQRYIIKGKLFDKLIPIYEKLCKDYPQE